MEIGSIEVFSSLWCEGKAVKSLSARSENSGTTLTKKTECTKLINKEE
jgi:hypothetical protein